MGNRDTDRYSPVVICLHWLMAVLIAGLFGLGLWMVELDYYHPWYNRAPEIHRSVGVCVFLLLLLRLGWRLLMPMPGPVPGMANWERKASIVVHWGFYLLVPAVAIAGYLMSTADGRAVEVFGLFEVPATITAIDNQEDVAGDVHFYFAVLLIAMALIHAAAALKHHLIDKDRTLKRMLGVDRKEKL